jgi:hypothetical protein
MFTLTYDKTGKIIAKSHYSEHQSTLPSDQIECTQEQFLNCQNYQIVDGKIVQIASDVILATLKADLCAKIDARAVEVGDSTVKSSVYLSSEYQRNASDAQAWKDAGYTGEPPLSVKTGAESHGLTYQEEAELILRESAMAEGFIETLRTWRMTAKGVQGIQGTHTATDAQAVFDAAMLALNNQLAAMKG